MNTFRFTYIHAVKLDVRIHDMKAKTIREAAREFPFTQMMTKEILSIRKMTEEELIEEAYQTDKKRLRPVYGDDWQQYRF